ncbi:MAG: HD domain-containing protein [candidate division WOR-3 bacterium]|nr:HD domain-containing protein [candidate division WOR-3 bacterium]MCX7947853.1 HD domain-containing protein [candidate division WOR-3 bacterium]MDW8150675.1 HD domain-containing protein [candidate division WOR-3 bacterium]
MEQKIELYLKQFPIYELLKETNSFIVGGTIRSLILNEEILDIDILTFDDINVIAKQIAKITSGTIVKLDENTIRVASDINYDISTPRGNNIFEDLSKRDFTINSIAYDIRNKIILDPMYGKNDISGKIIRISYLDAFKDDPLRLLRAIRFSAIYDFDFEMNTYNQMIKDAYLIKNVSGERIHYELIKMFSSNNPYKALKTLIDTNIGFYLFPELSDLKKPLPFLEQNILEHTLKVVEFLDFYLKYLDKSPFHYYLHRFKVLEKPENRAILVIAAIFHDIAKPKTHSYENGEVHFYGHDVEGAKIFKEIAKRLSFSRREIKIISNLILNHMHPHYLSSPETTKKAINRFLNRVEDISKGEEGWTFPLILIAFCDALATKLSHYGVSGHLKIARILEDILQEKEANQNKPPRLVTGYDIMERGISPSPIYKKILQEIEDLVVEGVIKTREQALSVLDEIIKKYKEQS